MSRRVAALAVGVTFCLASGCTDQAPGSEGADESGAGTVTTEATVPPITIELVGEPDPAGTVLRLDPTVGDKFEVVEESVVEITVNDDDDFSTTSTTSTTISMVEVLAVDDDSFTIRSVVTDAELMDASPPSLIPMYEDLQERSVGKAFEIRLSRSGAVEWVEATKRPDFSDLIDAETERLLAAVYDEAIDATGFAFPAFPSDPVAPGSSWRIHGTSTVLGLEFEISDEYTFVDSPADEPMLWGLRSMWTDGPQRSPSLPVSITVDEFSGGTSQITFDLDWPWPTSADSTMTWSAMYDLDRGEDIYLHHTLQQHQTTTRME